MSKQTETRGDEVGTACSGARIVKVSDTCTFEASDEEAILYGDWHYMLSETEPNESTNPKEIDMPKNETDPVRVSQLLKVIEELSNRVSELERWAESKDELERYISETE